MNHRRVLIVSLAGLLSAVSAAAQAPPAAATWTVASPGDHLDGAPGFTVAARRWITPRFGLEADFGHWRTRSTSTFDLPAQPGGIPAIHEVTTHTDMFYSVGVMAMVRLQTQRAGFVAGAGPALFVTTSRTRIETTMLGQTKPGAARLH